MVWGSRHSSVLDERLVGCRVDSDRLLHQAEEQLAAAAGTAAVEAEGEFVQVVVEMLMRHGAMMGPQQPALEQRRHLVDVWHQLGGCLGLPLEERDPMFVAVPPQGVVPHPAIGVDDTPGLDRLLHELQQTGPRRIGHALEADPTEAPGSGKV